MPAIHGMVRWRLRDLAWWIFEEFRISLDNTTVGRELSRLGYRKLSAQLQHRAQDEGAMDDVKIPPGAIGGDQGSASGRHRHRAVVVG